MARQPMYEVQCQAPSPNPRLARQGVVHGVRIGSSSLPIRYTQRVLDDVNQVRPSDGVVVHSVWCARCRKATEYEVVSQQAVA